MPLIQQFIYQNCKIQYNYLVNDGCILEKLIRLQVLSAEELNCQYYIEHNNDRLMSPAPEKRNCELEIDASGLPTIYVSVRKKDKPPGFLRESLMKLFMNEAEKQEEELFRNFLQSLLSDLPADQAELEELATSFNLQALEEGEEKWVVLSPIRPKIVEESSSEEEEYVMAQCQATAENTEVVEENKPLTSWPPRAAIDPKDSLHKKYTEKSNF